MLFLFLVFGLRPCYLIKSVSVVGQILLTWFMSANCILGMDGSRTGWFIFCFSPLWKYLSLLILPLGLMRFLWFLWLTKNFSLILQHTFHIVWHGQMRVYSVSAPILIEWRTLTNQSVSSFWCMDKWPHFPFNWISYKRIFLYIWFLREIRNVYSIPKDIWSVNEG